LRFWLLHTFAGLFTRVLAGCLIFATLALVDLHRRGARATRWREYLFLLACVLASLLYGAINDQITTTISWEYFAYGKGVAEALPSIAPNSLAFRLKVFKIGAMATWTAGLLIGVALLIANNPCRARAQLPYAQLLALLGRMFLLTATIASAFGVAGYLGLLARFSSDFREMLARDEFRPRRFMAVYGIHLGGYIGGLLATALACITIARRRRRLPITSAETRSDPSSNRKATVPPSPGPPAECE
jgi:hypothetical protein